MVPPPSPTTPSKRPPSAFTLIELLVSMTVLVVIVLLTSQLVNNATQLTTGSTKHLDADSQARTVFQRMAQDLSQMVKRPDADCIPAKIPLTGTSGDSGNDDKLFFYSEVPGFFDGDATQAALKSSVALVGYRINNGFQLERLGKLLTWDGAPAAGSGGSGASAPGGIVFLTSSPTVNPLPASTLAGNWPDTLGKPGDSPPYSSGTNDADYNVLAEQVFRLEFCYLLQPAPHKDATGTLQNIAKYSTLPITAPENVTNNLSAPRPPTLTDDSGAGYRLGSRWYDASNSRAYVCTNSATGQAIWKILGVQDVAGIVVTIAVLDAQTSRILPTFGAKLSNAQTLDLSFPDVRKLNAAFADAANDAAGSGATAPDFSITPPRLPAEAWTNTLNAPDFSQKTGVPQAAIRQIRIYQRCISLNNLR